MRDNQNTEPALSSETVNDRFWALICDDEQWLGAEFDGIVSEPAEHPTSPPPLMVITTDRDRPARSGGRTERIARPRNGITRPGPARTSGHQRSPPDPLTKTDALRTRSARR
jgi:hypothetical protein